MSKSLEQKLELAAQVVVDTNESIAELQQVVDLADGIERLEADNKDWKNLIEAYVVDEKTRLSNVLTSTAPITVEVEGQLVAKMSSIRHFRLFVSSILTESFHASESMKSFKKALKEQEEEVDRLCLAIEDRNTKKGS